MKQILLLAALCLAASVITLGQAAPQPTPTHDDPAQQTTNAYVRPNARERRVHYFKNMFGKTALAKNIIGAGISTWTNAPEEWGQHMDGFAKRVASNVGKSVINNTTAYGLEEAFKLDSRYYRSEKKGIVPRARHAIVSSLTARNENGKTVFGYPRIAGLYVSNVIAAETWYPKRHNWQDGMRGATTSLGINSLYNLIKEFVFR